MIQYFNVITTQIDKINIYKGAKIIIKLTLLNRYCVVSLNDEYNITLKKIKDPIVKTIDELRSNNLNLEDL